MDEQPDTFAADLEPGIDAQERGALWTVAATLIGTRPYPRAAFRATLRQRLSSTVGAHERPPALWARVGALALPAVVLLALVAVGVAHHGPFAP
jgi:hypothetical protein